MNVDEILRKDAFRGLDPAQASALSAALEQARGKSAMEAMPILMSHAKAFGRGGSVSQAQGAAMIDAVLETMPEAERRQWRSLLKLVENK